MDLTHRCVRDGFIGSALVQLWHSPLDDLEGHVLIRPGRTVAVAVRGAAPPRPPLTNPVPSPSNLSRTVPSASSRVQLVTLMQTAFVFILALGQQH